MNRLINQKREIYKKGKLFQWLLVISVQPTVEKIERQVLSFMYIVIAISHSRVVDDISAFVFTKRCAHALADNLGKVPRRPLRYTVCMCMRTGCT